MQTISDVIAQHHGKHPWVLARRTKRIVERYGDDVVCLSQKQYRDYERELDVANAPHHPAVPVLMDAGDMSRDRAAYFIAKLRVMGWRVEKIFERT